MRGLAWHSRNDSLYSCGWDKQVLAHKLVLSPNKMEVNGIIEINGDQEQKWKAGNVWKARLYRIPPLWCVRLLREICFMCKYKNIVKSVKFVTSVFCVIFLRFSWQWMFMDWRNVTSQSVLDRCRCYKTTLWLLLIWTCSSTLLVLIYHTIQCHTSKHKLNIQMLNTF